MSKTVYIKGVSIGEDVEYMVVYHTSFLEGNKIGNPVYTRGEIIQGIVITGVPDSAQNFLLISTSGQCSTVGTATITVATPTPTATITLTPTPTPTPTLLTQILGVGPANFSGICSYDMSSSNVTLFKDLATYTEIPTEGDIYYKDNIGTIPANPGYYRLMRYPDMVVKLAVGGEVILITSCI